MHQIKSSTTKSNVKFVVSNTKVVVRGSFLPLIKLFAFAGLIISLLVSFSGSANVYYTELAHATMLVCLVILTATLTQKNNPNPLKTRNNARD